MELDSTCCKKVQVAILIYLHIAKHVCMYKMDSFEQLVFNGSNLVISVNVITDNQRK